METANNPIKIIPPKQRCTIHQEAEEQNVSKPTLTLRKIKSDNMIKTRTVMEKSTTMFVANEILCRP